MTYCSISVLRVMTVCEAWPINTVTFLGLSTERKIIYSYKKGKVQLKNTTGTQITQIKQKPFLSKVTPDQNGIWGEGGKLLVMTRRYILT